ncbi:MAG: Ig-like domain-containing protein [Caldilineaceae bacterium]
MNRMLPSIRSTPQQWKLFFLFLFLMLLLWFNLGHGRAVESSSPSSVQSESQSSDSDHKEGESTSIYLPLINRGQTELVCNPSGGAGGLAAGTTLKTTFNNYPLLISVSRSYNPRVPGYLTIYLHGDEGGYDNGFSPVTGGVLIAPQSPKDEATGYYSWYALPEQNTDFLVALLQDVFAKYNLCRNIILGGSVSGGSVFYDRTFYPTQGASYPAFWSVNCGGGLLPDAQLQLQALSQRSDIVARTEFSYTIGTNDFLFGFTSESADYRQSLGFAVGKNYLPNVDHCAYNTAQVIQTYFEKKAIELTGKVNRSPVAYDDEAVAVVGRQMRINVLRNDIDPNSDLIAVTAVSAPALGSATMQGNQILYIPTSQQVGQDSFTYTISDGRGGQSSATVKVVVVVNSPPNARNDSFVVAGNSAANLLDVTYNDLDQNDFLNDPLTVTQVTAASHGLVAIQGMQLVYTPTANFSGSDTFTYTVVDASQASDQAVVTVTISPTVGIVVNTTTDELNQDGDCSLREAIQAANSDSAVDGCPAGKGADIVYLPAATYAIALVTSENGSLPLGESNNLSGDFDILADLTIQGATAGSTIIDGNRIDRVFHIARPNLKVTLQGLTIQKGLAQAQISDGFISTAGGAVLVAPTRNLGSPRGSLILDGTVVRDSAGDGQITVLDGSLEVRNSTITDTDGYTGIVSQGLLTMTNTTLVGQGVDFRGTSAQIVHSTFWVNQNIADYHAISAQNGTVTVQNSVVLGALEDLGCRTVLPGVIVSAGYNASNGSTCPFTQNVDRQNLTIDFAPLQANGGTPSLAPFKDSLLRNAIPSGASGCGSSFKQDQRAVARPQESACDIGAYEVLAGSPP